MVRKATQPGEISERLDIAAPTLSFHLKELTQAGLLTVRKESRYMHYSANFDRMNAVLAYLTENCCSHGAACDPACAPRQTTNRTQEEIRVSDQNRTFNVLFLCTGNSCRSILAEATFNHLAPPGWRAVSAGSKPTGKVHPRSLALLAREGISTEGYHSKSWDELPEVPDIVVTVCASAAGETCPVYLGPVLRTHWGVDDPAHATGTDAQIDAAFMRAYRTLRARIEAFSRCHSRSRGLSGVAARGAPSGSRAPEGRT